MALIDEFEQGKIDGYGKPERVLETLLSKLFFFSDRVVKIYKHTKAFYGDLSDPAFRKDFYAEDFFWNHSMSPEIYLALREVQADGATDYFIEMAKIDGSANLTNLLPAGRVSPKDMEAMTRYVVERLRFLTKERRERLAHLFGLGGKKLHEDGLEDLRQWLYLADDRIPRAESDGHVDLLKAHSLKDPYIADHDPALLSVSIDDNSDNLLFIDGSPAAIDTMTPKDNWKVNDESFNISRLAVDGYVLGSREHGDAVYRTYREYRTPLPPRASLVYEIRAALIQWPYRHMLGQHDLARRFKAFALRRIEELKTL